MPRIWYEAEVLEIILEAPEVKKFILKLTGEPPFSFRAGQFVTFDLPIGEKRLDRWRSYSIASRPQEDGIIELCIAKMRGGKGTAYFFEEVEVGTKLTCKGPEGSFLLPETQTSKYVMICTGTGVAPFRSMILDNFEQQRGQKFHLIFGCRKADEVLYRGEFDALLALHPDSFEYDICLSREDVEGTYRGYVHQVYREKYTQTDDVVFMICGWSGMIDEANKTLKEELGIDPKSIYFELYG